MSTEQFLPKDIPSSLLGEVTSEIKAFTTAFIAGFEQVGSGTFAVINGRHGILTAEHVEKGPTPEIVRSCPICAVRGKWSEVSLPVRDDRCL